MSNFGSMHMLGTGGHHHRSSGRFIARMVRRGVRRDMRQRRFRAQRDKQRKAWQKAQRTAAKVAKRAIVQTPQSPPRRTMGTRLLSWATGGWSEWKGIRVESPDADTQAMSPLERAVLQHTGQDISPRRHRTRTQDTTRTGRTQDARTRATRRDTTRDASRTESRAQSHEPDSDLVDALISLGFKKPLARSLAQQVPNADAMPLEDAVRTALSYHHTR